MRIQVPQKAWHKGVREGTRPLRPPCMSLLRLSYRARLLRGSTTALPCRARLRRPPSARFPTQPAFWALLTEPGRPLTLPSPAPTARASRTSRTFSRQARCQTRMQGSDLAWQEDAQSLCTFRTQRKRNRTTYLPSFPKKTSPSQRIRLREAESRRRLKL